MKPNCYKCKYKGDNPGDAHIQCLHPAFQKSRGDALSEVMAILAGVRRVAPIQGQGDGMVKVTGDRYGISQGWFNHPWSFDPVWLKSCNGFIKKEQEVDSNEKNSG